MYYCTRVRFRLIDRTRRKTQKTPPNSIAIDFIIYTSTHGVRLGISPTPQYRWPPNGNAFVFKNQTKIGKMDEKRSFFLSARYRYEQEDSLTNAAECIIIIIL